MNKSEEKTLNSFDEVDIFMYLSILWNKKNYLLIFTALSVALGLAYILNQKDIYKSDTLLMLNDLDSEQTMQNFGNLSGLIGFAGIDINQPTTSRSALGVEVLKSRDLFIEFAMKEEILIELLAVEKWDKVKRRLEIDKTIYDAQNNQWLESQNKFSINNGKPSIEEAHELFLKDHLSVSQDKNSGLFKIEVKHQSPDVAYRWLNILISKVNEKVKQQEVSKAQRSILYLEKQLQGNNIKPIQDILNNLIQKELSVISLANANPEYLFLVVDSPNIPERKDWPSRTLYLIYAFLIGISISSFSIIFFEILRRKKSMS